MDYRRRDRRDTPSMIPPKSSSSSRVASTSSYQDGRSYSDRSSRDRPSSGGLIDSRYSSRDSYRDSRRHRDPGSSRSRRELDPNDMDHDRRGRYRDRDDSHFSSNAAEGGTNDNNVPKLDEFGRAIEGREEVLRKAREREVQRKSWSSKQTTSRSRSRERTGDRVQSRSPSYRRESKCGGSDGGGEPEDEWQSCTGPSRTDDGGAGRLGVTLLKEDEEEVDEEAQMRALMGFGGFVTTKDKKHVDVSDAKVVKPREYRQYMNRKGGFNRPLSPKRS